MCNRYTYRRWEMSLIGHTRSRRLSSPNNILFEVPLNYNLQWNSAVDRHTHSVKATTTNFKIKTECNSKLAPQMSRTSAIFCPCSSANVSFLSLFGLRKKCDKLKILVNFGILILNVKASVLTLFDQTILQMCFPFLIFSLV